MKKIVIATVSVVFLVAALFYVFAVDHSDGQASNTEVSYQFASLGEECTVAATTYTQKASTKRGKLEIANADMQTKIAQTQSMIQGNAGSNADAINNARIGYENAYKQGYLSKAEYDSKMAQLGTIQATHGTPSSSAQQQLNGITANWNQHYAESKKQAGDMESAAAKLQACADSATQRKEFTVSEVADFKALIANSNQAE